MKRALAGILAALTLTACATNTTTTNTARPKPSHATRASTWPAPDPQLTPGGIVPGCTYPRPARSASEVTNTERAAIAHAYHYTGPAGLKAVEYDHLIPYSLCGAGGSAGTLNVWPEPYDGAPLSAFVHNFKDQLEDVIAGKVRSHAMTLSQGQAVFRGDWRHAWCVYVHAAGVTCDV